MITKRSLLLKVLQRAQTFQRLTGLAPQTFWELHKELLPKWQKATQKKQKAGRPYGLGELENHLFCLLLYYRVYTTQLFLGATLGVDSSTVSRSIKRLEPILSLIAKIKRKPQLQENELQYILIDCTEQPIQRPCKNQQSYYSGKKKQHTIKTEVRVTTKGRILSISKPAPGSKHDFALHKEQPALPAGTTAIADSGYQGLEKLHTHVSIPRKKQKGKRKEEDIHHNRELAIRRIVVEHIIRRLKIFQVLQQRYRNSITTYASKTAIIAGLVNLKAGC